MDVAAAATVFPLIFLGELPDKTMFASLVLAARGHPGFVWAGAAVAFALHVVIAVTVGVVLVALVPHRGLQTAVGVLFVGAAAYSWRSRHGDGDDESDMGPAATGLRTALTAGTVIFVAEWGDVTQILMANLAARYHDPLAVGLGSLAALWTVAGLAVVGGTGLLRALSLTRLRMVMAAALLILGGATLVATWT